MPDRFLHASHIVLDSREAAQELASKINRSKKVEKEFAKVARKKSLCASAKKNGGDLGWIRESRTPAEVSKAVWSQEPKKVGKPVETGRGFHIFLIHE